MPKAKAQTPALLKASPFKTAATILIALSFLANLGALLGYVMIQHTHHYDTGLYNYTERKVCGDFDILTDKEQELYTEFCNK